MDWRFIRSGQLRCTGFRAGLIRNRILSSWTRCRCLFGADKFRVINRSHAPRSREIEYGFDQVPSQVVRLLRFLAIWSAFVFFDHR